MKRDYKKWLEELCIEEGVFDEDGIPDVKEMNSRVYGDDAWIAAQIQVWDQIISDFEEDMEDLFGKKRGQQLINYISSLKAHYEQKRKYLQRLK